MRARLHVRGTRWKVLLGTLSAVALLFGVAWNSGAPALASVAKAPSYIPASQGRAGLQRLQPGTEAAARDDELHRHPRRPWCHQPEHLGRQVLRQRPLHRPRRAGRHIPVQHPRLRQQRELDAHPRPGPEGGAHRRQPGPRRLALVRAQPRAVVLDGPVRPQLLPADAVHARIGLQRPHLLRPELHHAASAAARPSWRCSSTRRATRRSSTAPAATTRTGARP